MISTLRDEILTSYSGGELGFEVNIQKRDSSLGVGLLGRARGGLKGSIQSRTRDQRVHIVFNCIYSRSFVHGMIRRIFHLFKKRLDIMVRLKCVS